MSSVNKAAKTAKVANLLQRKQTWYVRYQVPLSLQPLYGKREVVRTLGTTDKREATARLHAAYASIQREIADSVQQTRPVDYRSSAGVVAELNSITEAVRRGDFPEPDDPAGVFLADLYVDEALEAHDATHRHRDQDTGVPSDLDRAVVSAAESAYRAIHDPKYKPISEWAAAHLVSAEQAGLKRSTLLKRKRFLDEFMAWGGSRLDPRRLSIEQAVDYTDHLRAMDPEKVSPRVKKDALTNLHTSFEWLDLSSVSRSCAQRIARISLA